MIESAKCPGLCGYPSKPNRMAARTRTGGEELHRAEVVEAIEDAPDGIVGKGLRR